MDAGHDLGELLGSLTVSRRPGRWTVATSADGTLPTNIDFEAAIREDEGWTVVVDVETATEHGLAADGEWAWLTLDVYSALEAVGLTAAVAGALAARNVPCNVIAALRHDHLLVPVDQVDVAIAALEALRSEAR